MSLVTFIGPKPNLLGVDETTPLLRLESNQPVLTEDDIAKLKIIGATTQGAYRSMTLDITYDAAEGKKGMKKVSVMSDTPEGLEKGLSMAEKLMKLKKSQSNGESESEEGCSSCKGEGCPMCESEEESSSDESSEGSSQELSEMSPDEMKAMYEMLKNKLGK
jgi:hypothetical protein